MKSYWSKDNIEFLVNNFEQMTIEEIALIIGKTKFAVRSKLQKLRLSKKMYNRWTDDEVVLLTQTYYSGIPKSKLKELFNNRSVSAVREQARILGLCSPKEKNWSYEEDTFLKNNYYNKTYKHISSELNRTEQAIASRVRTLKLKNKHLIRPWTEEEVAFLINNINYMSNKELSVATKRTVLSIQHKIHELGISLESGERNKKYLVDDYYFDKRSLESLYWIGFILADGCIQNNQVTFHLQHKDLHHLDMLCRCVRFTGSPVESMTTKNRKRFKSARLSITSKIMVNTLGSVYNVTPRKTYTLLPPDNLGVNEIKALIIGFIDGDGCISYRSNQNKDVVLSFLGTYNFLSFIKDFFDKEYPTTKKYAKLSRSRGSKTFFTYHIQGNRALSILYDLSRFDVPKLERKWIKILLKQNLENIIGYLPISEREEV